MGTDCETGNNGDRYARGQGGRFGAGNRGGGRRRGPTSQTMTLQAIKQAVVDSWHEVNGPQILSDLAKNQPALYVKLVVGLLPREHKVETEAKRLVFNITQYPTPEHPSLPTVDAESYRTHHDVPFLPSDADD